MTVLAFTAVSSIFSLVTSSNFRAARGFSPKPLALAVTMVLTALLPQISLADVSAHDSAHDSASDNASDKASENANASTEPQLPTDISTMDTIVVTASRLPEPVKQTPAAIQTISQKTLQQSTVRELPSLLSTLPELTVIQPGYGQQASLFLRGTNSNHVLLLADGMRLNPATSSIPSWQFMDTSDLERIEILKGPASVQYGSDAIGGVVQLISKTPKKAGLRASLEVGEKSLYKAGLGLDLTRNDSYLQLQAHRLGTDGYHVSTDAKVDSGMSDQGVSVKLGTETTDYGYSLQLRQNQGTVDYLGSKPLSQDFRNQLWNLQSHWQLSPVLNWQARLSEFQDELDQNQSTDFAHTQHRELDTSLNWAFLPHQSLLFGTTLRKTDGSYANSFGTAYDRQLKSNAVFVQHQFQQGAWSTQAGLRSEDDRDFGRHQTGQLAARWHFLPQHSVYANLGTAFHAPDANQRYGFGGNPNLKPETSRSVELGLDQQWTHAISSGFAAYQTQAKQGINYDPANSYTAYNVDRARMRGAEASLNWKQDNWFARTAYSYVQPIDLSTDKDLLRRPRQSVTLQTGYDYGRCGGSVTVLAKSHNKDSGKENPGFATLGLNGYWQQTPYVRWFANAENAANIRYVVAQKFGGEYLARPRQASVGISFNY